GASLNCRQSLRRRFSLLGRLLVELIEDFLSVLPLKFADSETQNAVKKQVHITHFGHHHSAHIVQVENLVDRLVSHTFQFLEDPSPIRDENPLKLVLVNCVPESARGACRVKDNFRENVVAANSLDKFLSMRSRIP